MKVLLVGTGSVTASLTQQIMAQGHMVAGMLATVSPDQLGLFDYEGIVVIAPETSTSTETLTKAAENGKQIFICTAVSDGMAAWASATHIPTVPYPPSQTEVDSLLSGLRRGEAVDNTADQYRRVVIGGDAAARLMSNMVARKIAITSPKGGTGKTSVSVNLAVAYALAGYTTFLIDADGNGGALQYHMRMSETKPASTLIKLLRSAKDTARRPANDNIMASAASAGRYFNAFTPVAGLPTLKVLPGLITDDLGDQVLADESAINEVIAGLYETGVASNGIVIMDVGINPSHPVHRAALRNAEAISIVVKPEVPDLAETQRWLRRMIDSLAATSTKAAALQFVSQRIKLCYNMVYGGQFKHTHNVLLRSLQEKGLDLPLVPNGIIPIVDPQRAGDAVNSARVEDILVWRYKREKIEELEAYTGAMLDFASHFTPNIRDAAMAAGILPGSQKYNNSGWFFSRKAKAKA